MTDWTRTVEPTVEPVTIEEIKDHLRIDVEDDDAYLAALIMAAREHTEEVALWRALNTQTWTMWLDDWPDGDEILLPRPPLQSVSSVKYYDDDDNATTWATTNYYVDTDTEPGRVVLRNDASWPSDALRAANGVEVVYVAGYGDEASDVPSVVHHAMKILVAHLYENREPVVTGTIVSDVPMSYHALLAGLRMSPVVA